MLSPSSYLQGAFSVVFFVFNIILIETFGLKRSSKFDVFLKVKNGFKFVNLNSFLEEIVAF